VTERRKVSYEQDLALSRGRSVARANQRRRMADESARREVAEERERKDAEGSAQLLEARGGLEVGTRVRGLEAQWRMVWYEGTVQDGEFEDGGMPVLCDDGETRYLLRYRTERTEDAA
jgi:hypothetical protein